MNCKKFFPIIGFEGGRPVSLLNGCKVHRNVSDIVEWPDGSQECAHCARDRQEKLMTPEQLRNVAFHMPPYHEWVQHV